MVTVGLPALYVLGLASLAFTLPAVVFGLDLLGRRRVRLPSGGGLLLALLGWIALSGLQLRGASALTVFAYRSSLFASMVATYLWICATGRTRVPDGAIVRLLSALWVVLVGFGYAALLLPELDVPSLLQRLAPGPLGSESFFVDLTSIRLAESQAFLGYPVHRPAAPFPYANGWGSALALTTPFFVLDRIVGQPAERRRGGWVLLALAVVPVVVSLNRGLWICTLVTVGYVALRRAALGHWQVAARAAAAVVTVLVIVALSPLGSLVTDRLEGSEDSNESRSAVASLAVEGALESPLLGHGAPAQPETEGPPIGTHGLAWYLLFCHGIVGVGLFVAWLAGLLRRALVLTGERDIWLATVPIVAAVQLPIYGMLPQVVLLGAGAALVWRARHPEAATAPSDHPTWHLARIAPVDGAHTNA